MSTAATPLPSFSRPANQVGTAAELLHYQPYTNKQTSEVGWSRWASAKENFEIVQDSKTKYLLKFDNNFAKKHLVTITKKELSIEADTAKKEGGSPEENVKAAQKTLLDQKIVRILNARNREDDCTCGHPRFTSDDGKVKGHSNSGKSCYGCSTCTKYKPSYKLNRQAAGKPTSDPLKGAGAGESTCLVLNWIPLTEFQTIVSKSISSVDPDGKLAVGSEKHLKWDFGSGRMGAIRSAKKGAVDPEPKQTWVVVGAKKVANDATKFAATWQINHWENQG